MRGKLSLCLGALLLLFAASLHPVYRISVDGQPVPGFFSPAQLRAAETAARDTAEELSRGEAALPEARLRYTLRLRPADGEPAVLTDALLRAVDGIAVTDSVRVNGVPLGTVEDGNEMLELLRREIRSGMPEGAAVGNLGGRLQVFPVYSRPELAEDKEEMVRRITALAPVFYLDRQGKLV